MNTRSKGNPLPENVEIVLLDSIHTSPASKLYFGHVQYDETNDDRTLVKVALAHLTKFADRHVFTLFQNEGKLICQDGWVYHKCTSVMEMMESIINVVDENGVLVMNEVDQIEFFDKCIEEVIPIDGPNCIASSEWIAGTGALYFHQFPHEIPKSRDEVMFEKFICDMEYEDL
ncbi:hypothetical protein CDAR_422731 [Caerostris darwini]|uniref:Uncharacterized protein n=1 Tax=Caerostris darwini TaxID=1538125 RepID=A0AAV4W3P9_9ARAC|nr:hypothetical protein CDAR_422731 [Caerostris darwini]